MYSLLLAVQTLAPVLRLRGDLNVEIAENSFIHGSQNRGGVNLASAQLFEILQRLRSVRISISRHRQGNQHFICVQARVATAQMLSLQSLNRRN